MKIFFPNASILYPPSTGGHIHVFQLTRHLHSLGHEIISLEPDQSPVTRTYPRSMRSVLEALRTADVMYCRLAESPNNATRLTSPFLRWIVPERMAVAWELNVSLTGASTVRGRGTSQRHSELASLRRSARRVDLAICVTKGLAQQASDLLGIERTCVIQNGSDKELFRRDLPAPSDIELSPTRLQVVSIGSNPNSYHDIALVEELCATLDRRGLPIDVHLFGRSSELCSPRVPSSLRVHGPVSYLEMPQYLAHMDVGLALYNIPLDLGSPLKLFDYLSSGCVPICSAGQAVDEVLEDSEAGYVAATWTPESLVEVLVGLHEDRERLQRMRACGRALIERRYNWRTIAEETANRLAGIVKERAGRGVTLSRATL